MAQILAVASLFGNARFERIVPHVTLVPPINVSEVDLPEALAAVRRVATGTKPFRIGFSSLASFAPSARTVHLAVESRSGELERLRDRVRVGPLLRDDPRPFSPHVTLMTGASDDQIGAALAVGSARSEVGGLLEEWDVDRLFVMEQHRDEFGTRWKILSEEPLGEEVVVGRGGVELHLRCLEHVEPAVQRLLDEADCAASTDPGLVCVSAEVPGSAGAPVCVAVGRVVGECAHLDSLITTKQHRREGMAHQVLANWCYQSAMRGATIAVAAGPDGFLEQAGFTRLGHLVIRLLQ